MLNLTKTCLEHPAEVRVGCKPWSYEFMPAEVRVGCKPWSYEFMPAPDDIMN